MHSFAIKVGDAGARAPVRRRGTAAVALLLACAACATPPEPTQPWEPRLRGDAVVLLGEVHDHAEPHRLRLAVLRRALHAGWRPAIAMEQFDADRQADIERARRERPLDAQHLIDQAAPARSGWDWSHYRPVIALALQHGLPLLAANLPREQARRLVKDDYAAVLGAERVRELGLTPAPNADWQAAQEREMDAGHCKRLPAALLGGMARAQFARDALMAHIVREHAPRGVLLLAGNGHVRRGLGVPRWLAELPSSRLWAVGFVEAPDAQVSSGAFDAVVVTAPASRSADPCDQVLPPVPVRPSSNSSSMRQAGGGSSQPANSSGTLSTTTK